MKRASRQRGLLATVTVLTLLIFCSIAGAQNPKLVIFVLGE